MENSESDVLAYMDFPQNHWSKIYSTKPLECQNKEVKRRSAVVGIFPCEASIVRLIVAVLMETKDRVHGSGVKWGAPPRVACGLPDPCL